jgi:hypothetical protein
MASPFDSPAAPEAAMPAGAPRCPGCEAPLRGHEEFLCGECGDALSRAVDPTSRDTWQPGEQIPRGLPRPIYKGRPLPWAEESERTTPFGDPLDSERAWHDERLDDIFWENVAPPQCPSRLDEAWREGLCVLCGEPLGDEVYFFTDGEELAQGGLHPRCARLTRAHCPGVRDCWAMCQAQRAAWDELRRAAPGPGETYPDLLAPLPNEYEPVPENNRRANIP